MPSHRLPSVHVCVLISSSKEDTGHCITHFNDLILLFEHPISKQRSQRLGLLSDLPEIRTSTYESWKDTVQRIRDGSPWKRLKVLRMMVESKVEMKRVNEGLNTAVIKETD